MRKPETWWCIKSGNILLPYTARSTKRKCIEVAEKEFPFIMNDMKSLGYSCVPILVSERPKKVTNPTI